MFSHGVGGAPWWGRREGEWRWSKWRGCKGQDMDLRRTLITEAGPSYLPKYLATSSPPTPPCQALPPPGNPSKHFQRSSGFPSYLSPYGALWNKARLLQSLTESRMVPVPACSPGQTLLRWGWGRWINKMNRYVML